MLVTRHKSVNISLDRCFHCAPQQSKTQGSWPRSTDRFQVFSPEGRASMGECEGCFPAPGLYLLRFFDKSVLGSFANDLYDETPIISTERVA